MKKSPFAILSYTGNNLPDSMSFRGTVSVGELLTEYGKLIDGETRSMTLTIKTTATKSMVAVACVADAEEKKLALTALTASEQSTLAKLTKKLKDAEKAIAKARIDALPEDEKEVERWIVECISSRA